MIKILIADDEEIERLLIKKVIRTRLGDECSILEAENGRLAVEVATNNDISIVVMDISMPGIDGIEAARQIKLLKPAVSIIFLTAFDDFSYARKAVSVHAVDYLLKPCEDEELLNAIYEATRMSRLIRQVIKIEDLENRAEEEDNCGIACSEKNTAIVEQIRSFIHSNYNKDISLQYVAKAMSYSDAYFCKFFKDNFNVNFTTYVTNIRIKEAKKLLKDPKINIKDIGTAVGYGDSNYFTKVFRRVTGKKPSEYRENKVRENC